jgi:hypothetical protein
MRNYLQSLRKFLTVPHGLRAWRNQRLKNAGQRLPDPGTALFPSFLTPIWNPSSSNRNGERQAGKFRSLGHPRINPATPAAGGRVHIG